VESLKIITRGGLDPRGEVRLRVCQVERRRRVTSVHKANIMKLSDGLFWTAPGTSRVMYWTLSTTSASWTRRACNL